MNVNNSRDANNRRDTNSRGYNKKGRQQRQIYQEHHRQATAERTLATAGELSKDGTPATSDTVYQKHYEQATAPGKLATAGVLASEGTLATTYIPLISGKSNSSRDTSNSRGLPIEGSSAITYLPGT
jgi:hypothetical protein